MSSDEESRENIAFRATDEDFEHEAQGGYYGKRKRKFTKNDMIYGVFNDSDEEGGEEPSKYASEVAFIKSQTKSKRSSKRFDDDDDGNSSSNDELVGDAEDQEDEEEPDNQDNFQENDDSDSGQPQMQSSIKKSFKQIAEEEDEFSMIDARPAFGGVGGFGSPMETGPAGFVKRGTMNDDFNKPSKRHQPKSRTTTSTTTAPRPKPSPQAVKDIGKFEKNTKGVGMSLLMKMGYKPGTGLGREGQGIAEPIEVKQRPKGMGLAYKNFEEKTTQAKKDLMQAKAKDADEEEEEEEEVVREQNWKAGARRVGGKKRVVYKTVEELVKENKKASAPAASSTLKIIDMTGPQARILDKNERLPTQNYLGFSNAQQFPELRHNLRLIADIAGGEIQASDSQRRLHEKKAALLRETKQQLEQRVKSEANHISRLQSILKIVEECKQRAINDSSFDTQAFTEIFGRLQVSYREEYALYGLASLAVAVVAPMVKRHLADWVPLKEPTRDESLFWGWRALLQQSGNAQMYAEGRKGSVMTPYENMMYSIWLPKVRAAIINEWNPKESDTVINLLESWTPLLPSFIVGNIEDQLILPKLGESVQAWNPRLDPVPIHQWLHPWLPLLDDKLQSLYVGVRHKLALSLEAWQPHDQSAIAVLMPWKPVFHEADMEALLLRSVVPKLVMVLRTFVINPADQQMEPFYWVMNWIDLIPSEIFVSLWINEFFPKWTEILYTWLVNSPNHDEIVRWYLDWKNVFSRIGHYPEIEDQFRRGLDMMNQLAAPM